jgi:eukaryotic-like serine/threonine-protein kinase
MHEDTAELQEALGHRYRLLRELGRGGMATVYLAEDSERSERVALKLLRRELTVILGSTRFQREIEILTRLQHPNIVPVLDSRQAGTLFYYVMPYISGESLRERLVREGSLALDEVGRSCATSASLEPSRWRAASRFRPAAWWWGLPCT